MIQFVYRYQNAKSDSEIFFVLHFQVKPIRNLPVQGMKM